VQTRQNPGSSANSFRNYENVPLVRKPLLLTNDLLSSITFVNDLLIKVIIKCYQIRMIFFFNSEMKNILIIEDKCHIIDPYLP